MCIEMFTSCIMVYLMWHVSDMARQNRVEKQTNFWFSEGETISFFILGVFVFLLFLDGSTKIFAIIWIQYSEKVHWLENMNPVYWLKWSMPLL